MEKNKNFVQLSFPQVAVVEASAGSGKTYALAKRFLQLLINKADSPANCLSAILAITFTNKAAYEMKERILDILKNIALNSFPSQDQKKDILACLEVDYNFARQKALSLIEEIIHHYSFFQVKTIDSFINYLLLGCALHIKRSATFTIKRNYREPLLYALDFLIDKSLSDRKLKKEFNLFLRHYLFVENRGSWFPKNQILELMVSLFELVNRHGGSFEQYQVSTGQLLKEKDCAYQMIKGLIDEPYCGLNKRAYESILKFIQQENNHFDVANLPASLAKPRPPLNKKNSAELDFCQKWERTYQQIKKVVELEAEVAYNPYVSLFNKLNTIFDSFSQKEDVLFLSELNHQARFLFDREKITVAELYYRLATRLRHYLIDEFQDTSLLQWNNLEPMVQDSLSSGGTLFYVGDKKQAIYRFRGGQSRLFDKIKNDFLPYKPATLLLTKNWRSQKEIVEFNNFLFSLKNLSSFLEKSKISRQINKKSHLKEILANFSGSEQAYQKNNCLGYVYIEKLKEKDQKERNEIVKKKLIDLIFNLKERFNFADIALLARDNQEVELLTEWLLKEGLPPESEKTLNVLEHPQIKEIISFLHFLYSPIDDLSFASFILGRLFQKKSGLSQKTIRSFLFGLSLKQKKEKTNLYRIFAQNFSEAWEELIAPFFKTVGFVSVYELLVAIYRRYQVPANFNQAQAFFKKFLQLCKDSQAERIGLWGFLAYLEDPDSEKLYVNVAAKNSVKILTVHKAKGLEFPVVILPFLRMDISAETGTRATKSYLEEKNGSSLHLLRITKKQKAYSHRLDAIYQESFKQGCIDELNNIYVALTRPKNELYAFIPRKSGQSINQASFLIEEEKLEKGKKHKYPKSFFQGQTKKIEPSLYQDWPQFLSEDTSSLAVGEKRKSLKEGVIFHQALSFIGDCSKASIDNFLNQAVKNIKNKFFLKDAAFYKRQLKEIVASENLKEVFFHSQALLCREIELVNRKAKTKRIDRLLIFKDKILIIDYKKNRSAAAGVKEQLEDYRQALADIYPDKKIRGVVVYLDELSKEYLF